MDILTYKMHRPRGPMLWKHDKYNHKQDETGRKRKTGRRRKNENRKKLNDTERNGKKQKETERNRKKQ